MVSVAEGIAEALWGRGVRYAVGLPGGEVLDLMEAFRARGIRFILSNHETSAAFMAAVHGQLLGVPGVTVTTLGPGVTNLATGLGHALLDRQPVVAFTGAFPRSVRNVGSHQVVDHHRLLSGVAKGSHEVTPEDALVTLQRAMDLAVAPPPGPVHLDLEGEVARMEAKASLRIPPPHRLPLADTLVLNKAVQALRDARRPLMLVGLGALRGDAPGQVVSLGEHLGMPVLVTPKAKGLVDETRPNFLGVVGLGMAADEVLVEVLASVDVLLLVGYDPVEVVPRWLEALPPGATIVSLQEPSTPPAFPVVEVEVRGDVADALARIQAQLHAGVTVRWDSQEISTLRAKVLATLRGSPPSRGMAPTEALGILRRHFPRDGLVAVDVGSHKILACQAWTAHRPGTFLVSNGLSSMGFALPAANMAQLLRPGARVVCITGDGGLLMALHELEVTRRLNLPILVFLMDDGCLSLIKEKQRRRGFPNVGMDFGPVDWPHIAEGFGLRAVRVETPEQLEAVLSEGWPDGPWLVDVQVDWTSYGPIL